LKHVGIRGVGAYVPPRIIANEYFTELYGLSGRSIVKKTGILERRYLEPGMKMSDMAFEASRSALEDANIKPSEIDFIILATVTQEQIYPAMSCQIQDRLGVPRTAGAFDMSIGCAGFVYAFLTASQYVKAGFCKNVLVIGVDNCSRNMKVENEEDRGMNILFGDGAGAVVVSEVPNGMGLLSFTVGSDGSGGKYMLEDNDHRAYMNGEAIFNFASTEIPNAVRETLSKANLTLNHLDFLVPHQANLRILEKASQNLNFPLEKVATHAVQYYGNTSSASVPLALADEVKAGKIKNGDNIILAGFGAGLSWASALIKWGR
jgi:3-oxoacyl-[acyl-carrier-protein] synthase-3